ncbi:MAG: hypothetical protein KIT27_07500 [Legionellales bacterium]|nr:hypothetical protein [Legionellales bacterium]
MATLTDILTKKKPKATAHSNDAGYSQLWLNSKTGIGIKHKTHSPFTLQKHSAEYSKSITPPTNPTPTRGFFGNTDHKLSAVFQPRYMYNGVASNPFSNQNETPQKRFYSPYELAMLRQVGYVAHEEEHEKETE